MSAKFTEYKGLTPTVASEYWILEEENIFEKSVTTEGNQPFVF
jgi:hypothetical protein